MADLINALMLWYVLWSSSSDSGWFPTRSGCWSENASTMVDQLPQTPLIYFGSSEEIRKGGIATPQHGPLHWSVLVLHGGLEASTSLWKWDKALGSQASDCHRLRFSWRMNFETASITFSLYFKYFLPPLTTFKTTFSFTIPSSSHRAYMMSPFSCWTNLTGWKNFPL